MCKGPEVDSGLVCFRKAQQSWGLGNRVLVGPGEGRGRSAGARPSRAFKSNVSAGMRAGPEGVPAGGAGVRVIL